MIDLLLGSWGKAGVIGAAVLAFVAWRVVDVQTQQAAGAQKLAAKIEKATNEKISKGRTARRTVDSIPDERLRDPYFRD